MTISLSRIAQKRPVVAVVAGSGQVARTAVAAGADLLIALNAGIYRTLGSGSLASFLPFGNANQQTVDLLTSQVLPRAGSVPVIAGVLGADPSIDLSSHMDRLRRLGVYGVTNWPSLGFVNGQFREALEEAGFDRESEIRTLAEARRHGLVAIGFAHAPDDVERFAPLSDGLILNVGLTHRVDDRQDRKDQVQASIARLNAMIAAAGRGRQRPTCLMFGGAATSLEDFASVFRQSEVDGIAGGSIFERLPVERAVDAVIRQLKATAPEGDARSSDLIGGSAIMRELVDTIRRVARYNVNVCIGGETGSGKELVATEIHRQSPRSHEPLVTLNCGAIPESLLESELFGHERGSFTGADRRRIGKFELAHRGTLLLDEVADLSPRGQVALLRAIQQGEIVRVGGDQPIHVDVRIVTASHQDLASLVAGGRFRSDLYFRLNQVSIRVPSLAERPDDLPALVTALLHRLSARLGREVSGISRNFERRLREHRWPGNVRELEHVLCRAAILEESELLDGADFIPSGTGYPADPHDLSGRNENAASRKERAEEAIRRAGGNKSQAAAALGVSRKTLYSWLNDARRAGDEESSGR